jgi:hypothetical protein
MLACGTGCHMSNLVVIEQELNEKFEVAHCPRTGPLLPPRPKGVLISQIRIVT